ncbi:MAG: hypothetical protein ABSF22_20270 [Bryobacteraceae bacterium]
MRKVAILLAVFSLRAQTPLSPDLDALSKIRTRMIFNLEHQPNYTCVETIERSSRAKTTNKLKVVDTLRLEVALVDGREMFAWPGSKKFEDSDVTKLVPRGAIGNGNFSTHAQALFEGRAATFRYLGEEVFHGKKAIRFDYSVPQMLSGYRIRVAAASAIVAYHGSFYADPATFDIERIEVIADDLPAVLLLSSTEDEIDYAVARIGDGDFLLPAESQLTMHDLNGSENQNHVKFTACRQFSGESVITFDDAPGAKSDAAPVPIREFDLPAGIEVGLVLTEDIDLRTAAIGDQVHARVDRDVKQKGQLVIPKGATATGRITRLERRDNFSLLGLSFPEIEAPGILARMQGILTSVVGIVQPNRGGVTRLSLGEGLIPLSASQRRLARGCIMIWRT